ncbi:MAG: FAD:protein FMN transferase [Acidimicrobiales bacterium]|nr:FAD:protein FMN transferase [Acidimicrobiales bacterium]
MAAELRFRAMGSDAHVIVHGDPLLADLAREEIARLEATWSRFRPDSEVSTLNDRAGEWVEVSPDTQLLVERSILAATVTDGRFDPTVLGDVVRAGYDRDFALVSSGTGEPSSTQRHLHRGVDAIEVDAARGAVRLAEGTGFDPGGIGKGLAADLVAIRLDGEGAAGALINLGGDLRAVGYAPDGDDWQVDLDPTASGRPLTTVILERGAVATSTILRRTWIDRGKVRHHLIDPATGAPSTTDIVAASVLAAHGWQAEVLAKAALLAGLEEGLALIERLGADGVLVDARGGLHRSTSFERFELEPTLEVTP